MGLSRRAYARQRGCSEKAVRKAIASGRIPVEADGTIDPMKADAAWERPARQPRWGCPLRDLIEIACACCCGGRLS